MGRTATITLREHVGHEWLVGVARAMSLTARRLAPGFLDTVEPPEAEEEEEDELALFRDYNTRCSAWGYYIGDAEERRSRRIDLRGPTDRDPGPLEMEDATIADCPVVELTFEGR